MEMNKQEIDLENELDQIETEIVHVELDEYGMPIEEIDEEEENELIEMRKLILQKKTNSFVNYESKYDKTIQKPSFSSNENLPQKEKNNKLKLGDLHKIMDQKILDSKPKKFSSVRAMGKTRDKPKENIIEETIRKFNPKCIPYNFI